jgi:hypothetical protein
LGRSGLGAPDRRVGADRRRDCFALVYKVDGDEAIAGIIEARRPPPPQHPQLEKNAGRNTWCGGHGSEVRCRGPRDGR